LKEKNNLVFSKRSVTCFWLYCDFHFNTTIFSLQVPRGSSFSRSWSMSNSQLFYLLHIKIESRQVQCVVNHTTWCLFSVRILGEDYRTRFANLVWGIVTMWPNECAWRFYIWKKSHWHLLIWVKILDFHTLWKVTCLWKYSFDLTVV